LFNQDNLLLNTRLNQRLFQSTLPLKIILKGAPDIELLLILEQIGGPVPKRKDK
jgi:hypothetical protein